MNLPEFCIRRPVFSTVLSLLIITFGLAGLMNLPVRELPDVDMAVVSVTTAYTGAGPEIIDTDITEVIEGAVAGVAGVKKITSYSRLGRGGTTIEFESYRDIDEAAADVRAAVDRVRDNLPDQAEAPLIAKSESDADPVMRIAFTSDRMSPPEVTDYVERFIVDRLSTLDGVAQVELFGDRRYAIRVWLNRRAMAARNLTVEDIEAAIRRNNLELPAGEIESESRAFQVRTDTRLNRVEQFRNIVVSRVDGYLVRLGDVAEVALGVEENKTIARSDGLVAVGLRIIRQSQANTVSISDRVRAQLESIKPNLPEGMAFVIPSDDAIFINESITEVMRTLGIAVLIVILVNFAFLASLRATLVPAITIPVSVIGTFIGISALGFSINILTLLALILSIGIVVDDAIVVLENIQRRIDAGEKRMRAAVLGSRQVLFAILATTLTLIAVFMPISFMQGAAGKLFGEFGFVLAVSVTISTLVALTLCPMLCSRILQRTDGGNAASRWLDKAFERLADSYRRGLERAITKAPFVLAIAIAFAGLSYFAYEALPKELTPKEDRGVFFISISAPQGSNLAYTDKEVRKIERSLDYLYENGEAERILGFSGTWGRPHRGFIVVRLTHWDERGRHSTKTVREVMGTLSKQPGAWAMAINPAGLGLRGSRHPLQVVIGGPDYASVEKWSEEIVRKAAENPKLYNVDTDLERNQPQLSVKIDRARADDMGVRVESIARALQTLLASREVTTYVDRGREYSVILKARDEDRQTPQDLSNIFVRSDRSGELVPLTALVTLESGAAAPTLRRFNRLPSVTISASLGDGYSLGEAIEYMEGLANETLPSEARLGFSGQSQQFLETSSGIALVFGMALLIVFLVLAAQFESFVHPLIIMLSVPLAISGALMALWITGNSLNIYSQVGLVLLVGLMAKNGILIVEFANQLRDEGRSVREAVLEASAVRLRPILMTVVSTVLGAAPLVFASGAGAESRFAIGTVIIGGLSIASAMTLFLTPVLYDLLARFSTPASVTGEALDRELSETQTSGQAAE